MITRIEKITPNDFEEAFKAAFLVNRKKIHWNSATRRTGFMEACIYPTMSDCFPGVEFAYEHDGIDAVLYKSNDTGKKPEDEDILVAIEHENVVSDIGTELSHFKESKLPNALNVLITYTGSIKEYIYPHLDLMIGLRNNFLLILYSELEEKGVEKGVNKHERGEIIDWEFFTYKELLEEKVKKEDLMKDPVWLDYYTKRDS